MNEALPSSISPAQTTPFTMKALYFRDTGSLASLRVENIVDTLKLSFSESADVLREIVPLVNGDVLTPPELDTIAIEQGPRAYQAVLEGRAGRKQVIRF